MSSGFDPNPSPGPVPGNSLTGAPAGQLSVSGGGIIVAELTTIQEKAILAFAALQKVINSVPQLKPVQDQLQKTIDDLQKTIDKAKASGDSIGEYVAKMQLQVLQLKNGLGESTANTNEFNSMNHKALEGVVQLNGAVGEFVRFSGDGGPMPTAVNWLLYKIPEALRAATDARSFFAGMMTELNGVNHALDSTLGKMGEAKAASTEFLDVIASMNEHFAPKASFWLNKLVQDASDTGMSLADLSKQMMDLISAPGWVQLTGGLDGLLGDVNKLKNTMPTLLDYLKALDSGNKALAEHFERLMSMDPFMKKLIDYLKQIRGLAGA
jgi:uncharacterized phage infection (PIP) family protein YhgE